MTPAELDAIIENQQKLDALVDRALPMGSYYDGSPLRRAIQEVVNAAFSGGFRAGLAAGISYEECPTCRANWTVVAEMLAESGTWEPIDPAIGAFSLKTLVESQNHALARAVLVNCRTCREHFAPKGA